MKTFNRDYVYVHDRPDAQTVLSQLPRWFEGYNDIYPVFPGLAVEERYVRR